MSTLVDSVDGTLPRAAVTVDLDEIQATVLRYRPEPYYGSHVMLHIDDARAGREFLRRLAPHIDSAANWWNAGDAWIAVGISYAGLAALGVPEDSEAFRVGITNMYQLTDVNVHRIIRRSTTYGAPYDPNATSEHDDEVPRGIYFLFISAKAMATMEFLQEEWINDGNFMGLGKERDPNVGLQEEGATFTIPKDPVRRRIHGIENIQCRSRRRVPLHAEPVGVEMASGAQRLICELPPRCSPDSSVWEVAMAKITTYLASAIAAAIFVFAWSETSQAAASVMDHPGGTLEQRRACKDDAMKFCRKEIPDIPRITACMTKNKKNLSALCRTQFK